MGGLIYNSRNSFGLLAWPLQSTCTLQIYNSRNSFGLLARSCATNMFSCYLQQQKFVWLISRKKRDSERRTLIYNSRNSFGLLALNEEVGELTDLQQQKFVWLISPEVFKALREIDLQQQKFVWLISLVEHSNSFHNSSTIVEIRLAYQPRVHTCKY